MTEEIYKYPETKVIIAGSRHFSDYNLVENKLLDLGVDKQHCLIISGLAYGVDMMGFDFARKYNKDIWVYPAEWEKYGPAAGPIRNEQMAKVATHCIVIWDGKSKGSANMIKNAEKYNLKLINIII